MLPYIADMDPMGYVCPFQASIIGNQGNHKIRNNSQDVSVIQTKTLLVSNYWILAALIFSFQSYVLKAS